MRAVLIAACVIALVASDAPAASPTRLTITYLEDAGRPAQRTRWTVSCDPTGGTHPRRAAACRELARVGWAAFRPVPAATACAQIYGGPQVAIVSGRVGGRRVWARLTRADGCQIARWELLPSLLPAGGAR
jgi:hypothetical protein